ncbi:MAG: excinuclease ABC subunit UvrB [Leptotrichiaceae bacterium]|jgi:excinuclease ABC subunit B|nr:excinuclease ABC subunit UvrB [Leptotrichiaceae bacterium]MBP6167330.1 excinuclease ABC subunit UvrB [Leptotrichiaceae bacterium]MBP7025998.1 excinuclease ABC subunit UvrB [Leptotrichiaceae bacterium]MBP8636427.1 excinuclease ABC subunit UvrB [Leptotrichiaceae bacterium]MBP9538228.1 excinuclease ABC subunit UvrB [Leptotrichiaceae bacterium]
MDFKIVSKFQPTGDQPAAIEKIVDNIENGISDQILLGVTGSGKTFTVANVIEKLNRPALIMAPNKTLAAQLYNEYKQFFPENAVEYFVSYYDYYQPEAYVAVTDTYIEKDSSINDEIDKLRHAATAALLNRRDVIIVASVSAIYGLGSPEAYKKRSIPIDLETGFDRNELIHRLISLRYERNDIAFERGKFRVKGDVIDLHPSYQDTGYRFEFFGDDLEDISEINTLTGQKIREIKRITIMPATHYLSTEDSEVMFNSIKDELKERITYFEKKHMLLEAQRIKQRTEYDLEMIAEIGYCKGVENYSRYLTGKNEGEAPDTLIDYFPDDLVVFLDESHISVPQINGMYKGDRARKSSLIENGFRLPSAFDNRPLQFDEFFLKVPQVVYISATPGDYELNQSKSEVIEQLVRPTGIIEPEITIKPSKNQIDDLMDEIKMRTVKGQRVLVTTLTKKMAEELTDYYLEYGIKVKYMHSDIDTLERIEIIRGLRKGEFDVLVGINLLREGLDIPEVSLVAILEADKEGYLRSRRSLIQTMGRAARNIEGKVILYADKVTDSMKVAMDEVDRRREVQVEYNRINNIDPRNIISEISESLVNYEIIVEDDVNNIRNEYNSVKDIEKEIKLLEKEIKKLAEELNFEEAIRKRDKMAQLKKLMLEL